jgi:hypothetical protein
MHRDTDNMQKMQTLVTLKIILLLYIHMDKHKVETPISIQDLVVLLIPFNQLQNIFLILVGCKILL